MKILIVVDMQNDFITGSLGTPEAQAIVPNVNKKIFQALHQKNTLIFFTQDTHYDESYCYSLEGRKLPIKHCIRKTKGWEFEEKIQKKINAYNKKNHSLKNIFIIEKLSFGTTNMCMPILEEWDKRDEKIESIELCGLVTDCCVISNAVILKSQLYETPIIVDASCCAGSTPEAHRKALELMRDSLQIDVINWEDNNGERPEDM